MGHKRLAAAVIVAALGAGGLGTGLGLGLGGHSGAGGEALAPPSAEASYAYYETVARRFATEPGATYGPMMGGGASGSMMGDSGYARMMGHSGYTWMVGGAGAPGWMIGGSLPASMMGDSHDPGKVMGELFANAPGPRVSSSAAAQLGREVPPDATVDRSANRITFTGQSVDFAVVASPSMPAENFRVAGLTDPTIVIPLGAQVQVEVVNADQAMAHGFVVADQGTESAAMPMMSATPAFSGSALWFLGEPTSAGMHAGMVRFTASVAGTYSYFCPVPGHAQEGMVGTFVVRPAS